MLSAYELAQSVRDGASPMDAVGAALGRIDTYDTKIEAWVEVDREGALRVAQQQLTGALAGVPVGLKDIFDVAGMPTRLGAKPFAHYHPEADSAAATRLRTAGAVILGKTHTTAFAMQDPAPTRNPWNLDHTPGGSSSGSAAAVAAGMVQLALGSQTVGSTLRPAAYCGIVGLKPTHGRISAAGVFPLAPSFDHVGILSRNVRDAALGLSVLAGHDPNDPFSSERPIDDYLGAVAAASELQIGFAARFFPGVADDEVSRHLNKVAELLSAAGAHLREVEMPDTAEAIFESGQPVFRAEAAAVHALLFERYKDDYPPRIRNHIELGQATGAVEYVQALSACRQLRRALTDRLAGLDVILLPVAATTAPQGFSSTGSAIFCAPASFSGLPSIALPSDVSAYGLPLSVQLIAAPFAEARLLAAATLVERVLDFHAEPSLSA